MTLRIRGNAEQRWVWQGNVFSVHGDGVTPEHPISDAGGLHIIKFDVQVPATAAGAGADWHNSYPGQYGVGSFDLDLLRYLNPLDVAGKLNGKGNLALMRAHVLQGAGITGATPPTQAGGTTEIIIYCGFTQAWHYLGSMPSGVGYIAPSSRVDDAFIYGTDSGLGTRLLMNVNATTDPITAGRWRVVLQVAEV